MAPQHRSAQRNRGRIERERSARLREAAERVRDVRANKNLTRAEREAAVARKHVEAEQRHAAHLEEVRRRATRESDKVGEVAFINELGLMDLKADGPRGNKHVPFKRTPVRRRKKYYRKRSSSRRTRSRHQQSDAVRMIENGRRLAERGRATSSPTP